MGVKLGGTFKRILEKSGRFNAEKHSKIVDALNTLEEDLDDDDAKLVGEGLMTLAEATAHPEVEKSLKDKLKTKLKPEFLDPVDAITKPYEAILDEANKAEFNKADSSYKKLKIVTDFLSKGAGREGQDAANYKKELDKVLGQITAGDYITKSEYEKISTKVNSALEGKTYAELFAMAMPKMSAEKLKDKDVRDDFQSRTSKMVKKAGWLIDYESGEIRKQGTPEEAVLVEGTTKKMTVEDLSDVFFKEYETWEKKSDAGQEDQIEVPRGGAGSSFGGVAEKNFSRAKSV